MDDIRRIAVIGAGLMGHSIAVEFALRGLPVRIYDSDAARLADARDRMLRLTRVFVDNGLLTEDQVNAGVAHLEPTPDLAAACAEADYLAEAVPENLELKRGVYRELDRLAPARTIFASNTSGLPPSDLAAATNRPDRVIVAHYFNPAHLIPVVEVVRGRQTSDATAAATLALLRRIGKTPALVRKERPGFVANRLQAALLREATALVQDGVASAEDVDAIVRFGFGRRLAVFGPFVVADLAGLDVWASIAQAIFPTLDNTTNVPPLLREHADAGEYGAKTGRGFFPWPPDRLAAALATRDAALLRGLRDDARAASEQVPEQGGA